MRAVWYERQGPASEVFQVGELPAAEPGPGEVRVRVTRSGVNPGDTKKRRGWLGSEMPFPLVIPHSDGAGVIESVGEGVDPGRAGQRVWVFGAQSYRAFGTAAQLTVVPAQQAIDLPDSVSDDVGSDDFPAAAKQQAAADLTAAARDGALSIPVDALLPLEEAAQAHDRVDAGARARILLAIPD